MKLSCTYFVLLKIFFKKNLNLVLEVFVLVFISSNTILHYNSFADVEKTLGQPVYVSLYHWSLSCGIGLLAA